MSNLPLIAITMGDPAGIGPEIIVDALNDRNIFAICRPFVIGDYEVLYSVINKLSYNVSLNIISKPSDAEGMLGLVDLIAVSQLDSRCNLPGAPTLEGGRAMVDYIISAVHLVEEGEAAAMVTCPISKVLMQKAGYDFEGHTQLISDLTGTSEYVMMLAGERLRVALATIHCALREVPEILNSEMILRTICITGAALKKDFGIETPRLAVAALNPHAGEEGLFGSEENEIILPAVHKARTKGLILEGPLAPDTVFHKAAMGKFDAVIAMYHDQGLIPLKLLHFSDAVNVTLGLPIIRTSVDHGTAYDIAGKGKANSSSLKSAIRMAVDISKNRKKGKN